tara:strand:+ start:12334 stop:12936 length:603 start_codon:yes stop_codon:yes gene_type:complete
VALSVTLLAFEYRIPNPKVIPLPFESDEYMFKDEVIPPLILPKPPSPPTPPLPPAPSPEPKPEPVIGPIVDPVVVSEPLPTDSAFFIPDEKPVEEHLPFRIVEKMPSFMGGEKRLYAYLGKNTRYPALAQENDLEAKIHVQFVVNKDGSISDAKVLNPTGYGFDTEALRVINAMPNWSPGQQAGQNVRVLIVIPIIFSLM